MLSYYASFSWQIAVQFAYLEAYLVQGKSIQLWDEYELIHFLAATFQKSLILVRVSEPNYFL